MMMMMMTMMMTMMMMMITMTGVITRYYMPVAWRTNYKDEKRCYGYPPPGSELAIMLQIN